MEVGIMVDLSIFSVSSPENGSEKIPVQALTLQACPRLMYVFHVALNLLSSTCSPPSLLPPPSMAPVNPNLQVVIQREPMSPVPQW